MAPELRKKLTKLFILLIAINTVSIIKGLAGHELWRVDVALVCDAALFAFGVNAYLAAKSNDEELNA